MKSRRRRVLALFAFAGLVAGLVVTPRVAPADIEEQRARLLPPASCDNVLTAGPTWTDIRTVFRRIQCRNGTATPTTPAVVPPVNVPPPPPPMTRSGCCAAF